MEPTIAEGVKQKPVRTRKVLSSISPFVAYTFCVVAIALGLFARLYDLGGRPLAVDEYYLARSAQFILDKGVPEFPTGGYYTRSFPLQYAQASLCRLLGDTETAHRIPAAIFGVLTLILFYAFAKNFLSPSLALCGTALLAISSWQIEFSRFARMYTLFQFLTLAFFHTFYLAYYKDRRNLRFLPHVLGVMAVITHSLGVFLLPFLLAPLLMDRDIHLFNGIKEKRIFGCVSFLTLVAGAAYYKVEKILANFGVGDRHPPDFIPTVHSLIAREAIFPFFPANWAPLHVFIAAAVLGGAFIVTFLARNRGEFERAIVPLGLGLLVISSLFHLFALFALVLLFLIWRYDFHRILFRNRAAATVFLAACFMVAGWALWAVHDLNWAKKLYSGDYVKAVRATFFAFPDFYMPTFRAWLDNRVPMLFLLLGGCVVYEIIRIRREPWSRIITNPALLPVYVSVSFGIVSPEIYTTRYWFFTYPLLIVTALLVFQHLFIRLGVRLASKTDQVAGLLSAIILGVAFLLTEDFHLGQVLQPNTPDVSFRTGQYLKFQGHWYPRSDEMTPASFLNQNATPGDTILIAGRLPTLLYYLDGDLKPAIYMPRDADPRYPFRSRKRGTVELWSGLPLLGTQAEAQAYTRDVRELYVVTETRRDALGIDPAKVWSNRYAKSERVNLSRDGRVEVLKVQLAPGDASSISNLTTP